MTSQNDILRGVPTRSPSFPAPRVAVSTLFFLNGTFIGAWAPKIPEFANRLDLSEFALGLMIMCFGIGSLILMPIAGASIARYGATRTVRIVTLLFLPMLLILSVVPDRGTGALALFFFGGLTGAMDVSMNANAVQVERSMRRAIMSSCHAFWSLGAFAGAVTSGFVIETIGTLAHAVLLTTACAAGVALIWRSILPEAPDHAVQKQRIRLPRSPLPWLIGIMALFMMIPEGAILDWSALYLRNELGASLSLSGFAFGAFALGMVVVRFAGDHVRERFGAVRTLRYCTVIAAIGIILSGFAPNAWVAIIGFAICGVGISNMVPIAFSAAGNLPGFAQGIALSITTVMGYSGALFAPSIIGFVAQYTGFAPIFAAMPALFIVVLLLSHHATHADIGEKDDRP